MWMMLKIAGIFDSFSSTFFHPLLSFQHCFQKKENGRLTKESVNNNFNISYIYCRCTEKCSVDLINKNFVSFNMIETDGNNKTKTQEKKDGKNFMKHLWNWHLLSIISSNFGQISRRWQKVCKILPNVCQFVIFGTLLLKNVAKLWSKV